jgi:hypothetical protein
MKNAHDTTVRPIGTQQLDVLALAAGRFGKFDIACPSCGPFCKRPVSRRRKVLRVWHHDPAFATYNCMRCGAHGFSRNGDAASPKIDLQKRVEAERREVEDAERRRRRALAIFNEAVPIAGTPGEWYLTNRGIDVEALPNDMAEVLRWHPRCPWEQDRAPCMVALWTDVHTVKPKAIHRTAISPRGERIDRMSYGPTANCVIRLWPDETIEQGLVLGEGIETVLAAATRIEHLGALFRPAWAAGDAGHIEDFPVLAGIEALTILVDIEESGAGRRVAEICAARWRRAGREVIRLVPRAAGDFNDIIAREIAQ